MKLVMNQISSLEKVRVSDKLNYNQISSKTAVAGERVSYQVVINMEDVAPTQKLPVKVWVDSTLEDAKITLYRVNEVIVDKPAIGDVGDFHGDGYIIEEPGFLPDILVHEQAYPDTGKDMS